MAGFMEDELVIMKNRRTLQRLAAKPFDWENGRDYLLKVSALADSIELSVNGQLLLTARDADSPYLTGCYGLAIRNGSRCRMDRFEVACRG